MRGLSGAVAGKIVALAFIDTNCWHCQNLTGTLKVIARDYALRGVVLECAFNDRAQYALAEFQQRFDPPFPVGWNTRAAPVRGAIRADYSGEDVFSCDPDANTRAELNKLLHGAQAKHN